MRNIIVFLLPVILLFSFSVANAQGKSKEAKMNKGQVNSTVKKASNLGNAGLINDKDGKKDKKDKKDKGDKKDKDSQFEKSLKKESKKAIKDVLK
jgi:hypothetical protein